jgi:flavin reductase (DIM6/NTAB) family NADH-FMN oxidoreductase RutF
MTVLNYQELYKLLIGIVVPRPIAWISTVSKEGIPNLAPFSFFSVASTEPPMLSISIAPGDGDREGTEKDTLKNIRETKQFVVNVVTYPLAQAMKASSFEYPSETNEFDESCVTPIESSLVIPPRIKESPINMECTLEHIIPLGTDTLVIGRILSTHIIDEIYRNGRVDLEQLQPLARLAGNYSVLEKFFRL